MNNELILIVLPIYNVEKYLTKCIETVINQTYKNIEVILVDDGSTDSSSKICDEFKKKDGRIKVIHKKNGGLSDARNIGLEIAKGKYVGFIDSDDYIEKNMFEILYNKIIKYDADVVKCEYAYNNSNIANGTLNIKEDKFIKKEEFEPLFYDKFFVDMNVHNLWDQMFKKELIVDCLSYINTDITMGDDLEINIQLFKNIRNILFIPDVLYHYSYNCDSISNNSKIVNIKKKIVDITKSYYHAYESIEEYNVKDKIRYKQGVLKKLLDEVNNYQIDLIGNLRNKNESIKYLKWYYFEYEDMKKIKNNIKDINFDINKLKYKIFYKRINNSNIILAYLIGKLIWIRRILLSKRK